MDELKKTEQGQKFTYQMQIKEHHLDTFGHVNNAVYLQLYEEARWDFITRNDQGLDKIRQQEMGPVILQINIRFKRELRNRQNIRIESISTEIKKGLILTLEQKILNDKNQICSEATFTIGIMDLRKRELITPPPTWLKAIGLHQA